MKKPVLLLSLLLTLLLCTVAHATDDIAINATNFPDANFLAYCLAQPWGADGVLSQSEVPTITEINVEYKNIANLKGIQYFTALEQLYCGNNQLTSLNVNGLTALVDIECYENQLTKLDVSGLTALKELECDSNQLTSLNVSGLTALEALDCYSNQLTTLDVSGLTALKTLGCYINQLTQLDVRKLTKLKMLDCAINQLTTLDVSGLTALKSLYCCENQLTALDVSELTALENLDCTANQLTELDVSRLTALRMLSCEDNQLTALDVSKLTELVELRCTDNEMTTLDLTGKGLWLAFISPQRRTITNLTQINANTWTLPLSTLVPLAKLPLVHDLSSPNHTVTMDSTGFITLTGDTKTPTELTYIHDVAYIDFETGEVENLPMEVPLSLMLPPTPNPTHHRR